MFINFFFLSMIFLLSLTACSGFVKNLQRSTNSDGLSVDEKEVSLVKQVHLEKEKAKKEEADQEAKNNILQPGLLYSEFVNVWGKPDRSEFVDGVHLYWYDGKNPMYFAFKNKKLSGWFVDKDTIKDRKQEEEAKIAQEEREDLSRRQKAGAILKAMGEGMKNSAPRSPTNCTSSPSYGGGFTTRCY